MRPLWWALSQSDLSFIRIENVNIQKCREHMHDKEMSRPSKKGPISKPEGPWKKQIPKASSLLQTLRKSPCCLSLQCSLRQPRTFIHQWLSHLTSWGGFPATLVGTKCHLGLNRCEANVHRVHRLSSRAEGQFQIFTKIFTTSMSTRCWSSIAPKNMRLSCLAGSKTPA